ncbi:MAG: DUF1549 domain-containing protein, partial [Candidatus Hydrogenedentota bacterium]
MPSWLDEMIAPLQSLRENPEMMHAAMVHLPLALAVIGLPLALLALLPWKFARPIRITALICYLAILGAAIVAVNSGEAVHALVPSTLPEYIWNDLNEHETMARKIWIGSLVTAICLAISLIPRKRVAVLATISASLSAMATLAIVIQVGHLGGKLVYEHGLGTPPLYVEVHELARAMSAEQTDEAADEETMLLADAREISYQADIQPILQEYCYGCHSESEREGGLDLTTLEGILAGGEKDGPPIAFGDPGSSPLIDYVRGKRLPIMPKDEPALDEKKILLLEQWIRTADMETIRNELMASNSDPALLDIQMANTIPLMDQTIDGLIAITRTKPNPLAGVSFEALFRRVKFLARRNNPRVDPGESTGEKEKWMQEVEDTKDVKLAALYKLIDITSENQQRIFNEDGSTKWPNEDYLDLLHDLRWADLSERIAPPSPTDTDKLLDRYALVDQGNVPRLRRDLRKRWIPAPPKIPETSSTDNPIDAFIAEKALEDGIEFTFIPASNTAFQQRVYMDLIGVVPPIDRVRAFLNESTPDARRALIDELLARDDEYAANWVPFWEDAHCSSPTTGFNVPMGVRGDFRPTIYEAFQQNKPFDSWVTQLLDPFDEKFPPTYVIRGSRVELLQSASNVAQVFLSTGMKCAACHNHFSNAEWPQSRFLEFVSYFSGDDLELIRCEQPTGRILSPEFPWELPGISTAPPTGVDKLYARPSKIARLISDPANPRFTRSIINRLWKRYLGLGFFEPADDYRDDTYVSHPELLDWLANDLIMHNYDLKHTIRLILNSQTYQ